MDFIQNNDNHEKCINEIDGWKNEDLESDRFKNLFEKYFTYMEETMAGSHEKKAKFWINFACLMDMYLIFHHSVKMNDTQLFVYVLYQISSIFFSANHQDYAHCMTLHLLEMISLPEENLILLEMLDMALD